MVCVTNPSYYAVEAGEWGEGALIKVILVLATEPLGAFLSACLVVALSPASEERLEREK